MTKETDVTIRQAEVGFAIPPDIVLQNAMVAAKALKDVISKKDKPVILNGEQYLEYEDLQTLGQFYGYTVQTGDAVFTEIDGVKGAKAHADLIDFRTGEIIGGAEAYCMRDEEHWNTRPKYEWQGEGKDRRRVKVGDEIVPWFQLASMAQTRAGAKAFRNRLAWVVVLAGYRPTPAEEMTGDTASTDVKERRTVDKSAHWCELHGVNFFRKGRMKGYAHPIEGTDEWCNEPDEPPNQPSPGIRADMQKIVDEADKTKQNATEQRQEGQQGVVETKQVETVVGDPIGNVARRQLEKEEKTIKKFIRDMVDPATIKNLGDLLNAGLRNFGMTRKEMYEVCDVKTGMDIGDLAAAYQKLKDADSKKAH